MRDREFLRGTSWGGVAALLVILGGCSGGQTGDVGTGGGECYEVSRTALTQAEADEAGFPASLAIDRLLAVRQEGQPVWAALPPLLWHDRGETPPADRSAAGLLFVETGALEEVHRECEVELPEYPYARTLEVAVSYRLEIPELETALEGSGQMLLVPEEEPTHVSASASLDGEPALCLLQETASEQAMLDCDRGRVLATSACLDSDELVAPAPVPRSEQPLAALIAAMNDNSPLTLSCTAGESVEVSFQISAPDLYCLSLYATDVIPVVFSITAPELGLSSDAGYAAYIKVSEGACGVVEVVGGDEEGSASSAPQCTHMYIVPKGLPNGLSGSAALDIHDDGTTMLRITVNDYDSIGCSGEVVMLAGP